MIGHAARLTSSLSNRFQAARTFVPRVARTIPECGNQFPCNGTVQRGYWKQIKCCDAQAVDPENCERGINLFNLRITNYCDPNDKRNPYHRLCDYSAPCDYTNV
jgi:hypothetical protein